MMMMMMLINSDVDEDFWYLLLLHLASLTWFFFSGASWFNFFRWFFSCPQSVSHFLESLHWLLWIVSYREFIVPVNKVRNKKFITFRINSTIDKRNICLSKIQLYLRYHKSGFYIYKKRSNKYYKMINRS